MGDATVEEVKTECEKRMQAGEFIEASNRGSDRTFTSGND
jgi:hypothetical protein